MDTAKLRMGSASLREGGGSSQTRRREPSGGRDSPFLAACACRNKDFRRSQRLQFCKTCLHPLVLGKLSAYNIIRVFRPDGRVEDMRMKKRLAALLVALCLLPAMAMASEAVFDLNSWDGTGSASADAETVLIQGEASVPFHLSLSSEVKTVMLKDVTFTSPDHEDALWFDTQTTEPVTVIFEGNNVISGGDGDGMEAIFAARPIIIRPSEADGTHTLTLNGGDGVWGGHGVSADDVQIFGNVTAKGGDGTERGGDGIDASGDVAITGNVTITGGDGKESGGYGIYSSGDTTITGDATITGGKSGGYRGGHGINSFGDVTIIGDAIITGGDCEAERQSAGYGIDTSGRAVLSGDMVLTGGNGNNSGGIGLVARNGAALSGNITLVGGNGNKYGTIALRLYGGDVTLSGNVTAMGGHGDRGGDGVCLGDTEYALLETYTITGTLTAIGGNGKGQRGGDGIRVNSGRLVISNYITATGGTGSPNGRGVRADDVELTVLNLCGYESDDGKDWRETVRNTTRYYKTRPKMPDTGDASMLGAWICLLGASAAGMKLRRKK